MLRLVQISGVFAVAVFFTLVVVGNVFDHGTNLAELVIFQVEGKDVRHKAGRFDVG